MDSIFIVLAGIAVVLFCIIVLRLHAFLSLLIAALVTGLLTSQDQLYHFALQSGLSETDAVAMSAQSLGSRLASAFGSTSGKIGILIALASIIGAALMKSGAADKIVRSLLKLVGKKNGSLAFLTSSFALGIPVFFDTVFYLMIPLVKSLGVRDPKKFSLYVMCTIAGGVMAHSLIPPTPGPLFVARELGVDLGIMITVGIIVGITVVLAGYVYALWANKRWDLPMRDTPDITVEELKENTQVKDEDLPAIWISILPVLLPVLLIAGNTIMSMAFNTDGLEEGSFLSSLLNLLTFIGDPNIALLLSAGIAMYLLSTRLKDRAKFQKVLTDALLSAGMIILITSAGGTFGKMLQQTNIGEGISQLAGNYQTAILPLAFVITAVIRTAQGSATVAMVTTIGIMSGFGDATQLGFHPVYLAMVIGCGSKIIPWMNDSAFWIITRMTGMEEKETIRFFSYLLTVMGIAGLIISMILSKILPLT
ncbi:MAG: SLC13 family permease [Cyclobacteriaceae bacterium]